jgi:omega-6 fatty acid desaturase (delta-12 desaturase)
MATLRALLDRNLQMQRCSTVSTIDSVKQQKRTMIERYAKSDNAQGLTQILTTLVALAILWYLAIRGARISYYVTAAAMVPIALFTLRVFALMHDCGHGSLFRNHRLNRGFGFLLGVISGMPQYVWSKHHNYHHANNGNWEKYRGPYATLSVDEFAALSSTQKRLYRTKCSIAAAPLAGCIYLIFNPRFTWLKGTIGLVLHIIAKKVAQPSIAMSMHAASYKTRYWKSATEYWHMFWNNVVLLGSWALMCWLCGSGLFFAIYLITLSVAGGAGIVLFTVQHNFEHAYASDSKDWDFDMGAILGTSFLILPRWLNWFTVDIAYHHIHHLSANIPNYRLVQCHREYQHLFPDVKRVTLVQVYDALQCILWDRQAQRIISLSAYRWSIDAC